MSAFTIERFAEEFGIGRSSIFQAIKAGELKTITPIINGKELRRRLITEDEGNRWISTFPDSESASDA